MRFLVDNALSSEVARLLKDAGHDAVHVRDYELHAAEDPVILERAGAEDRILISADSDFGMLLAIFRRTKPSFVLFREPDVIRAADYVSLIVQNLPTIEHELLTGCVATFRHGRVRVRNLPLGGQKQ